MARETFEYGKLAAGKINYITRVNASTGTYAEGDILETTDGLTYAKATAVTIGNHYVVCAEDVTLSGTGEVVAYKGGYFNKHIVRVNDAEASANDIAILKTKDIFLEDVSAQ